MYKRLILPIFLAVTAIFAFIGVIKSPAAPQVGAFISVNTNSGGTGGPDCTLRDAMTTANLGINTGGCLLVGTGTPVTISLDAPGPYTLTTPAGAWPPFFANGLPYVTIHMVIEGNGQKVLRSYNENTPYFRIFFVAPEGHLVLRDLTVQNGETSGFSLSDAGGGILNLGYLELQHASVVSNTSFSAPGGGIMNLDWDTYTATLMIEDSEVGYNLGDGAIASELFGYVRITNSNIHHNYGVGLTTDLGTVEIMNSMFTDNGGPEGSHCGGGIFSFSNHFTMINSTVRDNTACNFGGNLFVAGDQVLIKNSTIADNESFYGDGGGIMSWSDSFQFINSTISGNTSNSVGGGLHVGGTVTITNSTISGNDAVGEGDGIYLAENSTLTLINTILTNHPDDDCAIYGTVTGENNLIDSPSCGAEPNFRLQAVSNFDPNLADNGGPTWTHALLPGSNAMDAIDCDNAPETDQRGLPRPQDGDGDGSFMCDIGSFEVESIATPTPTNTPEPSMTPTFTPTPTQTSSPTPTLTLTPTVTLTPEPPKSYLRYLPIVRR